MTKANGSPNNHHTCIHLVRHGETEENLAKILQGHMPGTLTAKGISQAQTLRSIIDINSFDVIISSDLKRVTDTVSIYLNGRKKAWETTPLLREIDWASMTGMKIADVDFKQLATDIETKEMLYKRAEIALKYILEKYHDKALLLVSHGLFLRSLIAQITNVPIDQLHTIRKMENCEVRTFTINQ